MVAGLRGRRENACMWLTPSRIAARGWQRNLLLAATCWAATALAAEPPAPATGPPPLLAAPPVRMLADVPYARVDDMALLLDLHLPSGVARPPLVVYLHGGAWRMGDKAEVPPFLAESGFAVASLNFRSSDIARFPANVHDIKAALRFLRANADRLGYRADRIAVSGSSSGGHLAALVGATNGHTTLEGTLGDYEHVSSSVQAIVCWVGASNLSTILAQSAPEGLKVRVPALQSLFGALPDEVPELAALASPVTHVDPSDPPLLILHGNQDLTIPVEQALELDAAYRNAGLAAETIILDGVGHMARPFFTGEPVRQVIDFLHRTIGE
jgi:acetyl esterase/lipase